MNKLMVNGAEMDLRETLAYALNNSQSPSFEELAIKKKLLEKVNAADELKPTTEEIQVIKQACLQTLKDGATLAIIAHFAPNDL